MMAGLLCLGITLILGIAEKLTTFFAVILMIFFTLSILPPSDNPLLEYHLVYILALAAVYLGGGYSCLGLEDRWKGSGLMKRFPILE
jgi:thiosulfate dehydrogenase [quinone] large subunit